MQTHKWQAVTFMVYEKIRAWMEKSPVAAKDEAEYSE